MSNADSYYETLKEELEKVEIELEEAMLKKQEASEEQDLRENVDYDIAKNDIDILRKRKTQLIQRINDQRNSSSSLTETFQLGCKVSVSKIAEDGSKGEPRIFAFEDHGDTIIKGILGKDSPLGKAILNGRPGIYKIHMDRDIEYYVDRVDNERD